MASTVEIPDQLVGRIREIATRPVEDFSRLNQWAHKNMQLLGRLDINEVLESTQSLGIPRAALVAMSGVLISLLLLPDAKISTEDVIAAISKSGVDGESVEKMRALVSGLHFTEAEFTRARAHILHAGLPTLSTVDAVSDLRAVFKSAANPSKSPEHKGNVTQLLGFVPVGIFSFIVNDSAGESKTITFQVERSAANRLQRTVEDLLLQLDHLENVVQKMNLEDKK